MLYKIINKILQYRFHSHSTACRHRFRLHHPLLPSLHSSSKSAQRDDAELGHKHKMSHMGHESVALDNMLSLQEQSTLADDPLLLWDNNPPLIPHSELPNSSSFQPHCQGFSHSSSWLNCPKNSPSNCSMSHIRSCESLSSTNHSPITKCNKNLPVRPHSAGKVIYKFKLSKDYNNLSRIILYVIM